MWHSFVVNLCDFWALFLARSVGHASGRGSHEILVIDKKVQQASCLSRWFFTSPPQVFGRSECPADKGRNLLNALRRLFVSQFSSVRTSAAQVYPSTRTRTLRAFHEECAKMRTTRRPRNEAPDTHTVLSLAIVRVHHRMQRTKRVSPYHDNGDSSMSVPSSWWGPYRTTTFF